MGRIGGSVPGVFHCMGVDRATDTNRATADSETPYAYSNPFNGPRQTSAIDGLETQAKTLGLTQQTLQKLDERLHAGTYQVSGPTLNDTSNLLQISPKKPQDLENIAAQALARLNGMAKAPPSMAQIALQSLADYGTMPALLGNGANGQQGGPSLRTYSIVELDADSKRDRDPNVHHYQINQNDWSVRNQGGQIQLENNATPVNPKEIGQNGAADISFRPADTYRNHPLPIADKLTQQLEAALSAPAQRRQLSQLVEQLPQLLQGNNPQQFQSALQPLAAAISQAFGIKPPNLVVKSFEGNALLSSWAASYDDKSNTLTINSQAIANKYAEAKNNAENAPQAATDAVSYLTSAVAHELGHDGQGAMASNPRQFGLNPNTDRLQDYKENQTSYTSPNLSKALTGLNDEYWRQPLEWDVNSLLQTPAAETVWRNADSAQPARPVSIDDWSKQTSSPLKA